MDTNETTLLYKDEVFQIVGCAMEVLNEVGHGFHEKPYENAMVVEFGLRNIDHAQQSRFELFYKKVKIGEYIPDLIVFGKIVVDLKVTERITDHEKGQMLNYLKITLKTAVGR